MHYQQNYKKVNKTLGLICHILFCAFFINLAYNQMAWSMPLVKTEQFIFQDWRLFKAEHGNRVICYLVSTPIKKGGSKERRGEPYFLLTDVMNDADEITASSGYIYKSTSDVQVSFGAEKFYLFPYMAVAWADNANDDIDVIKEMQKNDEMIVSGITRDDKTTHDTYSLIGFTQAYAKLKEECKYD